jgi:hypothetical protein
MPFTSSFPFRGYGTCRALVADEVALEGVVNDLDSILHRPVRAWQGFSQDANRYVQGELGSFFRRWRVRVTGDSLFVCRRMIAH